MKRQIVTDPAKFGGEPHIEGTAITVADVQAYWRQAGIGAAAIRQRFPELSEAELGAAVIYNPRNKPEFCYVAESPGPPKRRLYIWSTSPGWAFACGDCSADGSEQPGWDTWEGRWERILMYPESYAPKDIVWRDEQSGAVVDIYAASLKAQHE